MSFTECQGKPFYQQGLLKKHEAFETDFTVHRDRVNDVCANGEELIKKVVTSKIFYSIIYIYYFCVKFKKNRSSVLCSFCMFPTEQPPRRQHQCQDVSFARQSVWPGESSSSKENQAGWKLCLPAVQLESWCGGVLDWYEYRNVNMASFDRPFNTVSILNAAGLKRFLQAISNSLWGQT